MKNYIIKGFARRNNYFTEDENDDTEAVSDVDKNEQFEPFMVDTDVDKYITFIEESLDAGEAEMVIDEVQRWACKTIEKTNESVKLFMQNEDRKFASREVIMPIDVMKGIKGYDLVETECIFILVLESGRNRDNTSFVNKRFEKIWIPRLSDYSKNVRYESLLKCMFMLQELSHGDK